MKAKILLFVIFSVLVFGSIAGNITRQQAEKVALNFYLEQYNRFEGQISYDQLGILSVFTETNANQLLNIVRRPFCPDCYLLCP